MRRLLLFFLLIWSALGQAAPSTLQTVPAAYKGRFRPLEAYARLWLYDFYHHQKIIKKHLGLFQTPDRSALEWLWKVNFLGHTPWDEAPLFWIHHFTLKDLLGLPAKTDYFSYNQLYQAVFEDKESNLNLVRQLLLYHFAKAYRHSGNRARSEKQELTQLASGLWVIFKGDDIVVAATPKIPPWHHLKPGFVLLTNGRASIDKIEKQNKVWVEEIQHLLGLLQQFAQLSRSDVHDEFLSIVNELRAQNLTPQEIAHRIETQYPLKSRLSQAGSLFRCCLPEKIRVNGIR